MKILRERQSGEGGFGHPPGWFWVFALFALGLYLALPLIKFLIKRGLDPHVALVIGLIFSVAITACPLILGYFFLRRRCRTDRVFVESLKRSRKKLGK